MNKFITIAAAGALATIVSLSATAQSQAFFPLLGLVGIAAATTAVATTAAIADDQYYHNGYFGGPGWEGHVAACEGTYRSYDYRTDTYVRRVGGEFVRVYCDL